MTSYLGDIAHTHTPYSTSTNSELIAAIKADVLSATVAHVYTTDSQSGGRGQHGRSWLSPIGNVYLSLYVPIGDAPQTLHKLSGALSLCVGLALCQMPIITTLNQSRQSHKLPCIKVKWPNDLGFYPTLGLFHKLAGILIEPVIKNHVAIGAVIGVGLNVQKSPTIKDGLYHATSLYDLGERTLTPSQLYRPITEAFALAVAWHNKHTQPDLKTICLDDDFIRRFNHRHALHGKHVVVHSQNAHQSCRGICDGIDSSGGLVLSGTVVFDGMASLSR